VSEDITYFLVMPYFPEMTPRPEAMRLHVSLSRAINHAKNWVRQTLIDEYLETDPVVDVTLSEDTTSHRAFVGNHLVSADIYQVALVEDWVPIEGSNNV
jgi:hypothetical protein